MSSLPIITSWLLSGNFPPRSCLLIALLAWAPFKLLWKPLYPTRMMSKLLSSEQHLFRTSMKMPPPPRLCLTVEAAVLALVWAGRKNLSSSLAEGWGILGRGPQEGPWERWVGKAEGLTVSWAQCQAQKQDSNQKGQGLCSYSPIASPGVQFSPASWAMWLSLTPRRASHAAPASFPPPISSQGHPSLYLSEPWLPGPGAGSLPSTPDAFPPGKRTTGV